MLKAPEAVGHLFDGLDFRVEALAQGVRDSVREIAENVRQMAVDQLRSLDDGSDPGLTVIPTTTGIP